MSRVPSRPRGPRLARALLIVVASLVPVVIAADLTDRPPPTPIFVDGKLTLLGTDVTLGDAIRTLAIRAKPGRLLDVSGGVLDAHADPGRILLNGRRASRHTALDDGDRIQVVDGQDRTEGIVTSKRMLPGRSPGDPMFTLATSRVLQITRAGRISGDVVSIRYRSVGASHRPPEVALTFDDGPWPTSTEAILRELRRLHVHATFFMVGYLAERYPGIVRDVMRANMAIGDHSWSHPMPFRDLSPRRIQTEVVRPARLLRDRYGAKVTVFRPPGGSFDPRIVNVARSARLRVVNWSVDPRDYEAGSTASGIVRSVLRSVGPGSIVLMHDGGGDRTATVKAVPRIVRGIRRMGLKLVAIRVGAPPA
jgi:peptidoglycan/xylan/chitin deacetylase (PgdA/CDA1 family)